MKVQGPYADCGVGNFFMSGDIAVMGGGRLKGGNLCRQMLKLRNK